MKYQNYTKPHKKADVSSGTLSHSPESPNTVISLWFSWDKEIKKIAKAKLEEYKVGVPKHKRVK